MPVERFAHYHHEVGLTLAAPHLLLISLQRPCATRKLVAESSICECRLPDVPHRIALYRRTIFSHAVVVGLNVRTEEYCLPDHHHAGEASCHSPQPTLRKETPAFHTAPYPNLRHEQRHVYREDNQSGEREDVGRNELGAFASVGLAEELPGIGVPMAVKHDEHKHVAKAIGSYDSLQRHMQCPLRLSSRQRSQAAEQPSKNAIEKNIKNHGHWRVPPRLGVEHQ